MRPGGQFYREIGKRENGRPVRFYLGADESQALARVKQVRKLADGETMGVFLRHGKPVKTDALAGSYSNPDLTKVFAAQDKLWELWKDIFTPLEDAELPRKTSPEQIRQIRLKQQGVQTKTLAEMFGVCTDTIRVYCRKT